jgi:hypothetical protein
MVTVALLVTVALMAGAIVRDARRPLLPAKALGLAMAVMWVAFVAYPSIVIPPFLKVRLDDLTLATGVNVYRFMVGFLAALFSTCLLVGVAVATVLRSLSDEGNLLRLAEARTRLRALLAVATSWLISGVVTIGLLHRWAESIAGDAGPELAKLGSSSTILSSVFYSLMLAAVFGPAETVILGAAERVAIAERAITPGEREKWLTTNGFQSSLSGQLARLLAVLGPLITGVVGQFAKFG